MGLLNDAIQANYLYRKGYLDTLSPDRKKNIIGRNIIHRLYLVLVSVGKEFSNLWIDNNKIVFSNKVICAVNSKNNVNALNFLKHYNDTVLFCKFTTTGSKLDHTGHYIFVNKFYYSLLFLFLLPVILLSKVNRENLVHLHKAFGIKRMFKKLLKAQRPRRIVFANDHVPEIRSMLLAAKELGVKTVYIQHGSVSKYFPPLIFDYALLESQYSLDIYSNIGISAQTRIELIGIPRLENAQKIARHRSEIRNIGIAVNQNDSLEKVDKLIAFLVSKNYTITLRKHPSDVRIFQFSDNEVINGNNYTLTDFINEVDFLIASDSSIHVEANSLGCRSLYYMLHDNYAKYDYYGYVKNLFIDEVKTLEELRKYLTTFEYKTFDFHSSKMSYYNSSLISGSLPAIEEIKKYL